jgi:ribosomal protein S18 acetylase RimI-like enzyme
VSKTQQQTAQIVPIAEEHIAGFHECLDAVARERLYLAMVKAPSLESTRSFVLANIENGAPQFVALVEGRVVGWCDITPRKLEGFRHCAELGMGVLQQYRGMGIGERLVIAALQKAQEKGLERIELEVYASNVPAIKLYEKMGFAVEGVRKKARKIDGKYDDLVDMALFFTEQG